MKLYCFFLLLTFSLIGCAGSSKSGTNELKQKTGWYKVTNIDSTTSVFYNFIPLADDDDETVYVFIGKEEMKNNIYSQLTIGKWYKLHLQEYVLNSFMGNDSLSTMPGTSVNIGYKNTTISEFYKIVQILETK